LRSGGQFVWPIFGRGVEPKAALIAVLRKMLTILNEWFEIKRRGGRHAQPTHEAQAGCP